MWEANGCFYSRQDAKKRRVYCRHREQYYQSCTMKETEDGMDISMAWSMV